MKKLFTVLAFVFLPLFNLPQAVAGPDDTTEFFMSEPPTLFDLGMLRLEMNLSDLKGTEMWPEEWGNIILNYLWDDDKIQMTALSFELSETPSKDNLRQHCKKVITRLREFCTIDIETGLPVDGHSHCSSYFMHRGFSRPKVKSLRGELDKKFTTRCLILTTQTSEIFTMSGDLLSKSFNEENM